MGALEDIPGGEGPAVSPNAMGDENGNHAGNHTWVEIWDGQWHVLGAIEVTKLDDTWFLNNAAMQSKAPAEQKFRIYATSLNTADTSTQISSTFVTALLQPFTPLSPAGSAPARASAIANDARECP